MNIKVWENKINEQKKKKKEKTMKQRATDSVLVIHWSYKFESF